MGAMGTEFLIKAATSGHKWPLEELQFSVFAACFHLLQLSGISCIIIRAGDLL